MTALSSFVCDPDHTACIQSEEPRKSVKHDTGLYNNPSAKVDADQRRVERAGQARFPCGEPHTARSSQARTKRQSLFFKIQSSWRFHWLAGSR